MKKTIIALLALAGVAVGDSAPQKVSVSFADKYNVETGKTILTGNRSHLIFDDTDKTLNSWMLEFQMTKIYNGEGNTGGNNVLFATSRNGSEKQQVNAQGVPQTNSDGTPIMVDVERSGIGVYTWYDKSGITIGLNNSHATGASKIDIALSSVSETAPITLRFAYDAIDRKVYLYMLGNSTLSTVTLSEDNAKYGTLYGVSAGDGGTNTDNNDVDEKAMFWTDGGGSNYELKSLTDMSSIAGKSDVFANYVKNIPEPTTATLSLLALAGLAARRRRASR